MKAFWWVAPAVTVLALLSIYPLLFLLLSGFHSTTGDWTLGNFTRLASDRMLGEALLHTGAFVAVALSLELALGLALALLIDSVRRGRGFLRTAILLPMLLPPVVAAVIWRLIYNPQFGLLNGTIRALGGDPSKLTWTSGEGGALWSVIAVDVWEWTPFVFLLMSAALQSLPQEGARGRARRWGFALASAGRHRAATIETNPGAGGDAARHGPDSRVRSSVHSDAGGTGLCDGDDQSVHLPHGVPLLRLWLCGGDEHPAAGDCDCAGARIGTAVEDGGMRRWILAALLLAAGLVPVYWLLTISLKTEIDQFAVPPRWLFAATPEHYRALAHTRSIEQALWNSLIAAVGSTVLAMLAGVPAAYALTSLPWPAGWADRIGFWILSNRLLPPIVTIVPVFLMLRDLHLLNSVWSLMVVYMAFHLPFVVWMMRGFFAEVPKEIEEAARLDGASSFAILWSIVLPLVRPGLAATAVFCMIAAWNEFLLALILTQTGAASTLPVAIAARVTQYEIKWGVMAAAGVVAMLPVLIFAGLTQRYLVRGLSLGAVKG